VVKIKTLEVLQKEVDKHILNSKTGYFSPLSALARLIEEVGELAREINHYCGDKRKKCYEAAGSISEELGDIFFTVVCLCNIFKVDLEESFNKIMLKYKTRDKDRFN